MRVAPLFVLLLALIGCGGDDGDSTSEAVVDRDRAMPADVREFLDRVADEDQLAFTATYDVLQRLGGKESTVEVISTPPDLTIRAGDLEVVNGEGEAALMDLGIFSGFVTDGPAKAIEAAARRGDADAARYSTRDAAGVALDCIQIPVQGAVTSTACLTPDGIFGYVDTPAVRYELVSYAVER